MYKIVRGVEGRPSSIGKAKAKRNTTISAKHVYSEHIDNKHGGRAQPNCALLPPASGGGLLHHAWGDG